MTKLIPAMFLTVLTVCLCGCASTSVVRTWKAPERSLQRDQGVAVIGIEDRLIIRQGFENRFVRKLAGHGQNAIPTHDLLSLDEIKADKATAAIRIAREGATAVLIIRMVDQATYSQQVSTTPALYNPTLAGHDAFGWYDYYSMAFSQMGTVRGGTKQNVYFETSLHDLKTGQRLWWGESVTVLKENTDKLEAADVLVAKVVQAMRKDGIIR